MREWILWRAAATPAALIEPILRLNLTEDVAVLLTPSTNPWQAMFEGAAYRFIFHGLFGFLYISAGCTALFFLWEHTRPPKRTRFGSG